MYSYYKYFLLYIAFVFCVLGLYYPIDLFSQRSIELQKQILIKQAQTHFEDQVNTRVWNARYGGVYVFPQSGEKPNPYLKDNTLKTADNKTLIKINPAWMTRQLSEIAQIENFHFKITSLNPINPHNQPDAFEKRALSYMEAKKKSSYYEFDQNSTFHFMGALMTTQACLNCHKHQGYKVGDVRGGISLHLNSSEYEIATADIKNKALVMKIFVLIFLLSIVILIHRQLQNNEKLKAEVIRRTREIESTKELLQTVLDADNNLLLVYDKKNILFVNQTLLDFFAVESLEDFKKTYIQLFQLFSQCSDPELLDYFLDDTAWIHYLQSKGHKRELTVSIEQEHQLGHFKLHAKSINIEEKALHIVIFDEITQEVQKMHQLEDEAAKDPLTGLFNRGKFNRVLQQEITLAQSTELPLSVIFLDIDDFKSVNDTLGHDKGDSVLIELAGIITSSTRKGDLVARWGGEEFIITLAATDKEQAFKMAQKLREKVERFEFADVGKLTISLGVTGYEKFEDPARMIQRVDKALYQAKKEGKNRVILF